MYKKYDIISYKINIFFIYFNKKNKINAFKII